jgi:wolfamin
MTSNFDINHSKSSIYNTIIESATAMHNSASQVPQEDPQPLNTLNWDTYNRYCSQPAWEKVNKIQTQLRCSHLDGTQIHWEGVVSNVEIAKVKNIRFDLIKSYLPKFMANPIICFYGERNDVSCEKTESCEDIRRFLNEQRECNVDKWNRYI